MNSSKTKVKVETNISAEKTKFKGEDLIADVYDGYYKKPKESLENSDIEDDEKKNLVENNDENDDKKHEGV